MQLMKEKADVEAGIQKTKSEIEEANEKILDAKDQKMKADSNLASLTEQKDDLQKLEKEELTNRDNL